MLRSSRGVYLKQEQHAAFIQMENTVTATLGSLNSFTVDIQHTSEL